MLVNKTPQNYYPYLSKMVLAHADSYDQLVVGLQALSKCDQKGLNIYEEYHPAVAKTLVEPVPAMMEQIH